MTAYIVWIGFMIALFFQYEQIYDPSRIKKKNIKKKGLNKWKILDPLLKSKKVKKNFFYNKMPVKKKVGRPKKKVASPKKKVGRPKKKVASPKKKVKSPKKKVGRPKKKVVRTKRGNIQNFIKSLAERARNENWDPVDEWEDNTRLRIHKDGCAYFISILDMPNNKVKIRKLQPGDNPEYKEFGREEFENNIYKKVLNCEF